MSDEEDYEDEESEEPFDFEGILTAAKVAGFDYKNVFSPSESLTGMPLRMEQRIKKIRKIRKNRIFSEPYKAPSAQND